MTRDTRALSVVYLIIVLDAAGMGLVLPVLPGLLRGLGGEAATGWPFGVFLGLYAFMQFIFSPLIGSLSDRFGRKPILTVSLLFACVNYAVMAMQPPLLLLFAARAIAGMTGANMAVAAASIADISDGTERPKRFGRLAACFGLGFMLGPALGGVMSGWGLNYPFIAAAVISGATLLLAGFTFPETLKKGEQAREKPSLNPFNALISGVTRFKGLWPMLIIFILFTVIGEVGGSIWVLYGQTKFAWSGMTVGLSLAAFGLFHAAAQAALPGPLAARFGDRNVLLFGIACDAAAYVLIAQAVQGWQAFALIPVFCLGGLGAPILSGLAANHATEDEQGRLQGLLTSLSSLASIAAPVAVTSTFFATRTTFPGAVWVAGAALYLLCLPVVLGKALYRKVEC